MAAYSLERLPPDAIGWVDDEDFYLIMGLAYEKVCQFEHSLGREFPLSKNELIKQLGSEGLIKNQHGKYSHKIRIGSSTRSVLMMPLHLLEETSGF